MATLDSSVEVILHMHDLPVGKYEVRADFTVVQQINDDGSGGKFFVVDGDGVSSEVPPKFRVEPPTTLNQVIIE